MKLNKLAVVFAIVFMSNNTFAEKPPVDKKTVEIVSKKLVAAFGKIKPSTGLNEVSMDWLKNPEVAEVYSYKDLKKVAAINRVIWAMSENDKMIFSSHSKNQNQLAILLASRIQSYSNLISLLGSSDNEIGMRDFLNSERADLQLVINGKIPYSFYLSSSKAREDKFTYLYMTNEKFVMELLNFSNEETNDHDTMVKLANKTTASSIYNTCVTNIEICKGI